MSPGGKLPLVTDAAVATRVHEARQVAYELVGGCRDVVAGLDTETVEALGAVDAAAVRRFPAVRADEVTAPVRKEVVSMLETGLKQPKRKR